jgi:hypothetical protein
MGGTDNNLKTSIGHNWQEGPINAPTVLNSSLKCRPVLGRPRGGPQGAGRRPDRQPGRDGLHAHLGVSVLESIPGYVKEFKLVFGEDGIDIDKVTEAIAEFEETLVTPNSPFDQWLLGDKDALTAAELAGYQLFKDSGCVACHNGPAAGGTTFQKMGMVEPYQTDNPAEGRFAVTGKDADRFNFKVPTLRNVELTYPYFHDGEACDPGRGRGHHGPDPARQGIHPRGERPDRGLPEEHDRRSAELQRCRSCRRRPRTRRNRSRSTDDRHPAGPAPAGPADRLLADCRGGSGGAVSWCLPRQAAGIKLAQRDEVGIGQLLQAFLHEWRLWHLARGHAIIPHLVQEVALGLAGQRGRVLVLEVAVLLMTLLAILGMECLPALRQSRVDFLQLANPGLGPVIQGDLLELVGFVTLGDPPMIEPLRRSFRNACIVA